MDSSSGPSGPRVNFEAPSISFVHPRDQVNHTRLQSMSRAGESMPIAPDFSPFNLEALCIALSSRE